MKKIKKLLVCFMVGVLFVTQANLNTVTTQAANKKSTKTTKITLNYESCTVVKGKKITLKAYGTSKKSKLKNVTWKSSNKKIATVNSKGIVKGIKPGKVTISASIKGVKKKAVCKITVVKYTVTEKVKVSSVSVDLANVALTTGQVYQLTATVNPKNAMDKSVSWVSSNPSVATVDKGKVTALATGSTVITVTTVSGNKTASCNVTVTTPTTGLNITPASKQLLVNEQFQLTSNFTPTNADNKSVTWSSSDEKIVSVTDTGVITGLRPGTATITCTSGTFKSTSTVIVPTGYDVLDIQNVTDGDTVFSCYSCCSLSNDSGIISLYGDKTLSNNLSFKVADGASYQILNLSSELKTVTVTYKNLIRVYQFIYTKTENNGLITSLSDSDNMLTYYDFGNYGDGETISLYGYNSKLSDKFTVTSAPGTSAVVSNDPTGKYAKIITVTKGTDVYHMNVSYRREYNKVMIMGIKDNNKLFTGTDFYVNDYTDDVLGSGYLKLTGLSDKYSEDYTLEVGYGASYSFSANPDSNYVSLLTVKYGDLELKYDVSYVRDNRSAQVIDVTDGTNKIDFYVSNYDFSVGYIDVYGDNSTLSSEFDVTVASGYTYSIKDDPEGKYAKVIRVTNGEITRDYYVTYTCYSAIPVTNIKK